MEANTAANPETTGGSTNHKRRKSPAQEGDETCDGWLWADSLSLGLGWGGSCGNAVAVNINKARLAPWPACPFPLPLTWRDEAKPYIVCFASVASLLPITDAGNCKVAFLVPFYGGNQAVDNTCEAHKTLERREVLPWITPDRVAGGKRSPPIAAVVSFSGSPVLISVGGRLVMITALGECQMSLFSS